MNRPARTWVAMGMLLGACALARAQAPAPAAPPATQAAPKDDAGLLAELEQMQGKLAEVKDLSTDFVQEKYTAMLRKPLKSSGTIRMVGSLMRWDTKRPAESTMVIGDDGIRLYYPEQKLLEVYPLDQQLTKLAASPAPRIGVMKEHFAFARAKAGEVLAGADEGRYLAAVLTPKRESLQQHLRQVRLLVDRQTSYLKQMEMVDADGDRTVVRFEHLKTNSGLKLEDVTLKMPEGTKVSYPLSGDGKEPGKQG